MNVIHRANLLQTQSAGKKPTPDDGAGFLDYIALA